MKNVQLIVVIIVVTLVILLAIWCERRKRARQAIVQEREEKPPSCAICNCLPVSPPVLQEIPTLIVSFDEGGGKVFSPPFPGGPNIWDWPFLDLETYYIPPTCQTARPRAFPTINFLTGTVQLDASNNNPLGGYIMAAATDTKDYTQVYDQTPMASAMTQAEFAGGDYLLWGMPVDDLDFPPPTYPVSTYAVSEWVDLKPKWTLSGDQLTVSWDAFDVNACSLGPWEIVVSARDDTLVCQGQGNNVEFAGINVGNIVSITSTSLTIQLNSAPGGLEHNVSQVHAFAYPLCNKSSPSTFFVEANPFF